MPEIIQSYSSIEIPCFQQLFLKVRIFLQTVHFQGFLRLNALLAAKALFEPFITNSDKPAKRLQIILTFFKKVLETICLQLLKYFRTYDEDAIVAQLVLLPMTKYALIPKISPVGKDGLRQLVCLRAHDLCRLYEHAVLRVGHHFFCHIGIADESFCRGRVLGGGAVRCCGSARGACCL